MRLLDYEGAEIMLVDARRQLVAGKWG